jgi:vancomycin resistance protein YoaR
MPVSDSRDVSGDYARGTRRHTIQTGSRSPRTLSSSRVARQDRRGGIAGVLDSPLKLRIALIAAAIILVLVGVLVFDVARSWGKVHPGVTMAGIELGGLTRAEAMARIDAELGSRISSAPVDLFDDAQGAKLGPTDATVEIGGTVEAYGETPELADSHSWRITSVTIGATVDSQALVAEAYSIGRGADFLTGRVKASTVGVELEGSLVYGDSQLAALEDLLTIALGVPMSNAGIVFDEEAGSFVVVSAVIGHTVDHAAFVEALNLAFIDGTHRAVVPMTAVPVIIDDAKAEQVAQNVNEAITAPIALVYENEDSWQVITEQLGSWISTRIEGAAEGAGGPVAEDAGDSAAELVPFVNPDLVRTGITEVIGDRDPGIAAQNAKFVVEGNTVTITPSVDGTGIDYDKVAADFNLILFEQPNSVRKVNLTVTTLHPTITTEDAQSMGIVEQIATYTTEYPLATNPKIANIHLAADLINNSLIEPGGVWSFNETTGECNAERGFQNATSISDGEYVDDIGGGICQVATTIFNAVFDSGLPIEERVNHGYYLLSYPPGRDATVSWPMPDLKFSNDTEHWVLLTMSYTDDSITATLWGTNPGYIVESGDSGFVERVKYEHVEEDNDEMYVGETNIRQYGADGRTISVWRNVYSSSGELIREGVFRSVYAPEDEIVEVGTKPLE